MKKRRRVLCSVTKPKQESLRKEITPVIWATSNAAIITLPRSAPLYDSRLMAVAMLAVEIPPSRAAISHGPHHEDCPRAIYFERERLKFIWGVARYGDRFEYLPKERDWRRVWIKNVPECTCHPVMGVLVELRPRPTHTNGNGHKNGAIKVHYQHRLTAPIYSQLRDRLSVWAFKTTGKLDLIDAELDVLAPMAGRTSKAVLNTLLASETKHHRRHRA